jgi:hypothetical protein
MLPLIVIGATQAMTDLLHPYAEVGHIEYHRSAEEAHWTLSDALNRAYSASGVTELLVQATEDGRWQAHVAYGPDCFGPIAVARVGTNPPLLGHMGHTLLLGYEVHEPPANIRVRDGAEAGMPEDTMIWQAAVLASADLIVDMASPEAISHMANYLEWKDAS